MDVNQSPNSHLFVVKFSLKIFFSTFAISSFVWLFIYNPWNLSFSSTNRDQFFEGWHQVSNLSQYLREEEINGLRSRECSDWFEGPCCPSGKPYGWWSNRMMDMEPLTYVFGDYKPFRMKFLLATLSLWSKREKMEVWLFGDSTARQLFFGFLCGFIRIDAKVNSCIMRHNNQLSHRKCRQGEVNVAEIEYGNLHVRLRLIISLEHGKFPKGIMPELFIINVGLHANYKEELGQLLQESIATLPKIYYPKIVWRETTIQHFPSVNNDGLYHETQSYNGKAWIYTCVPILNKEHARWRLDYTQEWLKDHKMNFTVLRMFDAEVDLWQTYPMPSGDGKTDCTHHVYTPLYFDVIFERLARILHEREGQG